ncbi:xanthosine triphosphate pyrophosphatase [Fructobacillus sp. M2-14]|uniref:Xanthosine triphosphate pyrophosphatase n=1 Tax=Fructobacillus broussonetiae TaxID=2713173 RepID=A0ABS5R196_9LACO|nr:non-canonical purine NTP pyrophosphatase [Fructobacillus broussonetiae]MBS9338279.1 xanthosine triphosphate pyrophosphatase [Fructobacillus broussonetiae]
MQIVFATNNKKKVMELNKFGSLLGFDIIGYQDLVGERLSFPSESTDDQSENAKQKALFIHAHLQDEWVLADDTSFNLEAFPDRFGVTASREFESLGLSGSKEINDYLLDLYKDVPDDKRGAYFLSTMAICSPDGEVTIASARGGVAIAHEAHGGPDFGGITDILLGENGKTLSAMPLAEVNDYHDRSRALRLVVRKAGL